VQLRTARSIADVMKIVGEARKVWELPLDKELWFRGEDRKHRVSTLLPKLYRHLPDDVEKVSKSLLREERNLLEEFERCGAQLCDHDDPDDWDWYFLMQHHNAPTRLLDWSDGALMAVHFAMKGDLDTTNGGFVYVLNPWGLMRDLKSRPFWKQLIKSWKDYRLARIKSGHECDEEWDVVYLPGNHLLKESSKSSKTEKPELPIEPLVLEFPQITRRVAAQRSRFMVYGSGKDWLTKWAKKKDAPIWRITIPKSSVAEVRVQLRDAGVTESVIYPDLDGLGRELDQLWSSLTKQPKFKK
jgi:hypothetical protein